MKKHFVLGLSLMMAWAIFSCDKQQDLMGDDLLVASSPQKAISSPNNSSNPYDQLGKLHNSEMNSLFDEVRKINTLRAFNGEEKITAFDLACEKYDISNTVKLNIESSLSMPNYIDDYNSILASSAANQVIQHNLRDMFSELRIKSENNQINTYEDFGKIILSMEDKIIKDDNLTIENKKDLLSVAATFRHSAHNWYNEQVEADTNIPIYILTPSRKLKWWKWLILGAADALGGLAGGGGFNVGTAVTASTFAKSFLEESKLDDTKKMQVKSDDGYAVRIDQDKKVYVLGTTGLGGN